MQSSFLLSTFLVLSAISLTAAEDDPEVVDLIAIWERRAEQEANRLADWLKTSKVRPDESIGSKQALNLKPPPIDLCKDSSIDAITMTEDGSIYVFKEDYFWQLNSTGLISKYPEKIVDGWPGLENRVDSVFTWPSGYTYFTKGEKYWRFKNRVPSRQGYPKKISTGFPGSPESDIDAALFRLIPNQTNQPKLTTYFFKKDKYWAYDMGMQCVLHWRSKTIAKDWLGLPESGIDAVFTDGDAKTYVFKGNQYFRLAQDSMSVDQSSQAYPRPTAVYWFGCELGER